MMKPIQYVPLRKGQMETYLKMAKRENVYSGRFPFHRRPSNSCAESRNATPVRSSCSCIRALRTLIRRANSIATTGALRKPPDWKAFVSVI